MPAASRITRALVEEVIGRRRRGECWKAIGADLRRRGLPTDRATWWRAGVREVAQRREACAAEQAACTQAA